MVQQPTLSVIFQAHTTMHEFYMALRMPELGNVHRREAARPSSTETTLMDT